MASTITSRTIKLLLILILTIGVNAGTGPFGMQGYENHTEGFLGIDGTMFGVEVDYKGTIEEIYARLQHDHPTVEISFDASSTQATLDANLAIIQRRGKQLPPSCCPVAGWGWQPAALNQIQLGIQYLSGVTAPCSVGARSCIRVSCSWNSAIYLCNDNSYDIFPSCPYIGSYAYDLSGWCWFKGVEVNHLVCGQEFDTDGYNVIVRYADEGC